MIFFVCEEDRLELEAAAGAAGGGAGGCGVDADEEEEEEEADGAETTDDAVDSDNEYLTSTRSIGLRDSGRADQSSTTRGRGGKPPWNDTSREGGHSPVNTNLAASFSRVLPSKSFDEEDRGGKCLIASLRRSS